MDRAHVQYVVSRYVIPVGVITIMAGLIALSAVNFFYEQQRTDLNVISHDLAKLANIFERINDECGILSFDHQKNHINFLNVEKFAGSEVGPMNLVNPQKWQGPYVQDNPTVQGHEYLVVSTQKGFHITPGEGVELPNGKIVGRDLLLSPDTDLETLATDPEGFSYRGTPLILPLKIGK